MRSKSGKDGGPGPALAPDMASSVKESAQQIWLAGLGAFSRAQAEGGKVFEALVKQGLDLQRQSQSAAEEKLQEAGARMSRMAGELSNRATGQWDKVGNIFEERVAKSLQRLGVPSSKELEELGVRLSKLEAKLKSPMAKSTRLARPAAAKAKNAGAAKAGAKSALKPVASSLNESAVKAPAKTARRKSA